MEISTESESHNRSLKQLNVDQAVLSWITPSLTVQDSSSFWPAIEFSEIGGSESTSFVPARAPASCHRRSTTAVGNVGSGAGNSAMEADFSHLISAEQTSFTTYDAPAPSRSIVSLCRTNSTLVLILTKMASKNRVWRLLLLLYFALTRSPERSIFCCTVMTLCM